MTLVHTNLRTNPQLPFLEAVRSRASVLRRRLATVAAGALAIMMGYGVVFGHNGLTSFAHKREEERSLQREMQQLQIENDKLQVQVEHLQNDPGAIEYEAHQELHYTRPGEVIYILPSASKGAAPAQPVDQH